MPPQGESTGFAIEDAILFSRLLNEAAPSTSIESTTARYERNRRKKIDDAFDEAAFRWETVKDAGLLKTVAKEWLTGVFLWWTKEQRDEGFAFDIREAALIA
jgi:salicylate hydroxylase